MFPEDNIYSSQPEAMLSNGNLRKAPSSREFPLRDRLIFGILTTVTASYRLTGLLEEKVSEGIRGVDGRPIQPL